MKASEYVRIFSNCGWWGRLEETSQNNKKPQVK